MALVQELDSIQTITADGAQIALPDPRSPNEAVWFVFVNADAGDMELVVNSGDANGIPLPRAQSDLQKEGPFRLSSSDIPTHIRLGSGSTIRVTVLRSG